MALAVMAQGAHRKERPLGLFKGHAGIQRLAQRLSRQVNAPAAGGIQPSPASKFLAYSANSQLPTMTSPR